MAKKVLINGRVTKAENCEKILSDGMVVNVVEFTYEFEYDGMVYEGKATKGIGTNNKETLREGSLIPVYFYPDTKKWIRKQENEKLAIGMKVRKIFLILLIMIPIYIILTIYNVGAFQKGVAFICYTIGIGLLLKEILFYIDKKHGKYNKVAATFKGYDKRRHDKKTYYHKTYIVNDTGELYRSPTGTNIRGNMEIGQETFLYRHIEYETLREDTNFGTGMLGFLICGVMGTAFAFWV